MLRSTSELTLRESSLIYGSNVSEIGDFTGESNRKKFSFKHAHHYIHSNIFIYIWCYLHDPAHRHILDIRYVACISVSLWRGLDGSSFRLFLLLLLLHLPFFLFLSGPFTDWVCHIFQIIPTRIINIIIFKYNYFTVLSSLINKSFTFW